MDLLGHHHTNLVDILNGQPATCETSECLQIVLPDSTPTAFGILLTKNHRQVKDSGT